MTKYIIVKLTEDQATDLANFLANDISASKQWLDLYANKSDKEKSVSNTWNTKRKAEVERKLAFRKRILTTLAQAKTQDNS